MELDKLYDKCQLESQDMSVDWPKLKKLLTAWHDIDGAATTKANPKPTLESGGAGTK